MTQNRLSQNQSSLSRSQSLFYQRQVVIEDIGEAGQSRLLKSKVLIVGVGGLGTHVGTNLALAGVGTIVLNDYDEVEVSNLHRQTLYRVADCGSPKTTVALKRLKEFNPEVEVFEINQSLAQAEFEEVVSGVDLVIDCLDNFPSRYRLHAAARYAKRPVISAGAVEWKGHCALFPYQNESDPCFACLFPKGEYDDQNCNERGIFCSLVGVIAGIQSSMAIQWCTEECSDDRSVLTQYFHSIDLKEWRMTRHAFNKDFNCSECGKNE